MLFNFLQIIVVAASVALTGGDSSGVQVEYEDLRKEAKQCRCAKNPPSDELLNTLIEVEKSFNPPESVRGMVLAAACMESCFNPRAKGDRKFSKSGKKPMAIGILQLWPIYERMFPGLDRTNPKQAATGWMTHIVRQLPKVKRQCKYRKPYKLWVAAWVTGIRYKKKGGRCRERPNHLRLLKKWHKKIKKQKGHQDGRGH